MRLSINPSATGCNPNAELIQEAQHSSRISQSIHETPSVQQEFATRNRLDEMAVSLGINKPRILVDPLGPPLCSLGKAASGLAIRSDFIKPSKFPKAPFEGVKGFIV